MIRTYKPVRANIGKKTLLTTDVSSTAEFTRGVRRAVNDVVDNYLAWVDHMEDAAPEVLIEALTPTFEDSQKLVPVDTSDLKNSGYLEARKFRGRAQVEIGYSKGGSPHYGPIVHENLEAFHAEPTQAKFLEQPLAENADQIRQFIQAGFKEASGV